MNHDIFLNNQLSVDYKTRWSTIRDAKQWAIEAFEQGCGPTITVEQAITSVIETTRTNMSISPMFRPDFIAILWSASEMLSPFNYAASLACMRAIGDIAGTNYDIATFLLQSQTIVGGFVLGERTIINFSEKANIEIIRAAIHMLRAEYNGHSNSARVILETFISGDFPNIIKSAARLQ